MVRYKLMIFFSTVISIFICVCILLIHFLFSSPTPDPKNTFRQYIMNPIPESVTNMKADQPKRFGGYIYVLYFNINRDDLDLIIASRPFEKINKVEYRNGTLHADCNTQDLKDFVASVFEAKNETFEGTHASILNIYSINLIVYHPEGKREPIWFKTNDWNNSEAYAFQKVGDKINTQIYEYKKGAYDKEVTHVILYNGKKKEAYYILSCLTY